jgi:deoxyadenosine/deoxycytidine kinase
MPCIVIDGNIGSGKTTQLSLLESKGWTVRREPIDQWPLEEFYKDPSRWAFYFHMVILQTLRPLKTPKAVVYERSLLSSRWVFWPVLVKKGHVTPGEDRTYSYFYDQFSWLPDIYIFLSKKVDLAWEHIQKRNQAGDSGVTLEYLKELEIEYQKLVMNVPCKVYVLDANGTAEEIHNEICKILSENELLFSNTLGNEMQKKGRPGREVPCTPFTNMCRLS